MRYNIKGKNMEIGERTKEKVSDKLDRAKKLFPEDAEATVVIKNEKLEYIVEVTIPMSKRVVRAEVSADDMMTAVDKAVDIIERQIVRYKKRLKTQMNMMQLIFPLMMRTMIHYIRLKRARSSKSDLCRQKKRLCRWSFSDTVSLYSEMMKQNL